MSGSLIALLAIATISLIVVRVGATALVMTGVSWDIARFQAYSAFFGVGFTTSEAEMVVDHPVRRRIIRNLILFGNVGITSALASLVVTFVQPQDASGHLTSLALILAGIATFATIAKLGFLQRALDWAIRTSLSHAGVIHATDYELLLRVQSGFCVSEVKVLPGCRLADKTLQESRPADDGIVVLGIQKGGGDYIGAPGPLDQIETGDVIMVYGKDEAISDVARCGE